jgi:hypothetical protein
LKVDELKYGELYKIGKSIKVISNQILRRHVRMIKSAEDVQSNTDSYDVLPVGISFIAFWNHKRHNGSDEKAFIYLGYTREKWSLRFARAIIKKHHWLLFNGKKVILDNYSIRFLQKVVGHEDEQLERS